jgi:hypothetical protein
MMKSMLKSSALLALIILVASAIVCPIRADNSPTEDTQTNANQVVQDGDLCLSFRADKKEQLDLRKVEELFEVSLEHLANATEYVTRMRAIAPGDERLVNVVKNFDLNGSRLVLAISETRINLQNEHNYAIKSGKRPERIRELLERYLNKGCKFKEATIRTEDWMRDLWRNKGETMVPV